MKKKLFTSLILMALLSACSGGGSGGTVAGSTSREADSIVLNGQVFDGPIEGVQVCLFSDGIQARNAAGAAICSSKTDAQGSYAITVPRSLPPSLLTLVASKGTDIKLVSSLGTLSQILEEAGNGRAVISANVPAARITHLTTASFALADTNNDGTD